MDPGTRSWPLRGLSYFISHPRLWLRPLVGTALGYGLILLIFLGVLYLAWPDGTATVPPPPPETTGGEDGGFWAAIGDWFGGLWDGFAGFFGWLFTYLAAFGWAILAALLGWALLLPLIMGFAYEHLVRRVFHHEAVATADETVITAIFSASQVLLRTLHWRLLWPAISLGSIFFVPFLAPLIGQFGLSHIAAIDGCDLALSLRGVTGKERSRLIAQHRRGMWGGVWVATAIGLVMGVTFLAWLLFLPMVFTGTALWVAHWQIDRDAVVTAGALAAGPATGEAGDSPADKPAGKPSALPDEPSA